MSEKGWQVREKPTGLEVPLHIQARARRNEITGLHDGALKLRVSAPPVDDAANRAVIAFLASLLEVPRSRLRIVSGQKSKNKILGINGMSLDHLRKRLPGTPIHSS